VAEGEELTLSDCLDTQGRRHGDPLPRQLRNFLHEWATVSVPKRWEEYVAAHNEGEPWLDPADLGAFSRFLRDYLLTDEVFETLLGQLGPVVNLKTRDEAARRRARRNYVRIILNDFINNPGASLAPLKPHADPNHQHDEEEGDGDGQRGPDYDRYGLMGPFVRRWAERMPLALALAAGEHVKLPPGNAQLIDILAPFEK
jgi:hypothetical protein